MRIAIIGSGISGLVCGYRLHEQHDITVYEANDYIGGHTHTHDLDIDGQQHAVDSGFIVFNRYNYPHFSRLLDQIGISAQPTSMSFSVHDEASGLEYNGTSVNRLFAQRRNLLRPSFHRMVLDILRFNRDCPRLLAGSDNQQTLADYVAEHGYSTGFRDHYLIPMCAALWSAPPGTIETFPIRFLVQFFHNHGMLAINDRPQWLVVSGGSARYVHALTRSFSDRIRLNTPVRRVEDHGNHQRVLTDNDSADYDRVIFACHSDQALELLAAPTAVERALLSAMPYQANEAVIHTDAGRLPQRRRAWASWNYRIPVQGSGQAMVTYYMNSLQRLNSREPICVSLNQTQSIAPERIIKRLRYTHPLFVAPAVAAQSRWSEISGVNGRHYCGAYWGHGFHEDGVNSALAVCRQLRDDQP
ncbi:putative NAD/FAD-binding protein [Methylohalomonas lacus]|uniref:NAD/FAD-binding protein n=1 Tax=Methylohalomonas lacus TaxID=398773 RepID=A0AAE3L0E4_9GAMM|nr:FAD-dependent oxidoreductase [Methylohalomonas lacus]MCS3902349.1 putative NAD/FAD-binding protein [Methylohalomonas lacus]